MSPTQARTGSACPDPEDVEDVNTRIRDLMRLPPTPERAAEYERLLHLWTRRAEAA